MNDIPAGPFADLMLRVTDQNRGMKHPKEPWAESPPGESVTLSPVAYARARCCVNALVDVPHPEGWVWHAIIADARAAIAACQGTA